MKNFDIFEKIFMVFFASFALIVIAPVLYLSVCFLNENVFGFGKTINYCVMEPTNKAGTLYSDEYKLIGIRRWQINNVVLGAYPTAKEAFEAATKLNCQVDK